ncbi:PREDICTED: uncharacterized protein LOC105969361 [Erythranthe guttata]|uniref:uncharacterized protein LOC105969361 n=1 Tax=Erythranthe guttata TaxID=4155 RepID=UPI00064D8A57|nr:PREDICTED: uncharacterized protein LOC105969361 [Erythranthe guttata]|eukprot:XP_012849572.1 PREDICTED: uncharacterized protein LOC105969361 [Erythranthe guttata]
MGRVEGLWKAFKETWKLPENEATKKWFNETANGRWKDAKTKRLKAVFDRAPDLATAKANCPNRISVQTWEKLCDQFHSISTPGVDGKSKSTKCKDSRKKVSTDHHWGRTSINSWSHNHFKKLGKNPTVFDTYKKAYMGIDVRRETGPSISEEGDTEEPYNGIATPEQLRISADLERVYDETIRDGSDESTANSIAIEKVLGKSKGLGIKIATTTKSSKSRFSSIPPEVQMEMNSMKEQMLLKDEKMERLEAELKETREIVNTLVGRFGLQASTSTPSNDGGV